MTEGDTGGQRETERKKKGDTEKDEEKDGDTVSKKPARYGEIGEREKRHKK